MFWPFVHLLMLKKKMFYCRLKTKQILIPKLWQKCLNMKKIILDFIKNIVFFPKTQYLK